MKSAKTRPNILLITTDQQRHDSVGPLAPAWMRAPHFDHLRRGGITFTSAYADCPICVPSRVSIMTGKTVFQHGLCFNGTSSDAVDRGTSLPTCLARAGYQTAAIGKMHFTPQRARHGFDEMILPADYYRTMRQSGSVFQPMRHGLGQNELYPGMATVPECCTLTAWTAEQCVDYIRERRDPGLPFFLWCSFSKPHPPLDPPEPYYSMYRDCEIPSPVRGEWSADDRCPDAFRRARQGQSYDRVPDAVLREARAAYAGLITQIDYNLGRVFAALQDCRLFDETLMLYTSDHGEFLGDHGAGGKKFFHEPAAHVPFVLRPPQSWGGDLAGTECRALVTPADVLPTLLTAAGGPIPGGVDGLNALAVAAGQAEPRALLEATVGSPGATALSEVDYLALTDGRWKYIWYPHGAAEQLFDLNSDPHELQDLSEATEHKARKEALRETLLRRHRERRSPCLEEGRLPKRAIDPRGERECRARSWPGYHTEYHEVDVRH